MFWSLNVSPNPQDLVDRFECICKGKYSNEEHYHEWDHNFDAGCDHSDESAVIRESGHLDQETKPQDERNPCLYGPEINSVLVVSEDIPDNSKVAHERVILDVLLEVFKTCVVDLWDLLQDEVADEDQKEDGDNCVLIVKVSDVNQDDV